MLQQEIERIKKELADIGCKTMCGRSVSDLVKAIFEEVLKDD